MSGPSYLALAALTAMVTFYAVEDRSPLAPLGFSAASAVAASSECVLGCWPFGMIGLVFAVVALRRWYLIRRRNSHE